jgi:hypothetical protein
MLYWLNDTLAAAPAFLAVFVGLGIPWALAITPRRDWSRRVQVAAVALLAAPALLTAWMFVLGMFGALRLEATLLGALVIGVAGAALAWRKRRPAKAPSPGTRLAADEWLLIVLIGAALVVRAWVTAWWNFTAYDALWVYGYQGRLYALLGQIPAEIGYYPPFMALQYAFGQLAMGSIDDHAARAGLMLLHFGAILAVYVLGARLFNSRRVGIAAAALWALYPHVGEWSRAGDLEIPLAFAFALASTFWLLAWIGEQPRRAYALLAGLALGVGLWIKPTMGAFILGVALMLLLDGVRIRFVWRDWRPRLELALIAGTACLPLGGAWYVRNLLLGHNPVDFPPGFWQSLAARSGAEFGWLILALAVLLATIYLRRGAARPNGLLVAAGVGLLALGLLPSWRGSARIMALEWLALASGAVLLAWAFWRAFARHLSESARVDLGKIGWVWALGAPYFVVWFYAYSYHYRLSFAIVPLLLLPTAYLLAKLLTPPRRALVRAVYLAALMLVALPGVVSAVYDPFIGWTYLWSDAYPDDDSRYRSGNAALMNVVDGLRVWVNDHPGETLRATAPGVDRLPFFFPLHDIRTDATPTRLDELDDVTYFVYGLPETRSAYEGVPFLTNQVIGALGRTDIMRRAWGMDDGIFRYDVYELQLDQRFTETTPNGIAPDLVEFGGFARYIGYDISGLEFWEDRRLVFKLYWEVLAPPPADYSILIHLRDADGSLIASWDGPAFRTETSYYSTLMWQPGERIIDERWLELSGEALRSVGQGYELVIGFYDAATQASVPVTMNGAAHGEDYMIENRIVILAQPPS